MVEEEQNKASMKDKEETPNSSNGKGGLKTMPFIVVNESLEKVASYGLLPNMILYLTTEYHLSLASGASILFIWGALSNFIPIFGAFLSDSYFGKFRVIALGCILTLTGITVLWLTAVLPGAKPEPCTFGSPDCKSPTASQMALLFSSFVFMSLGSGGLRPCSLAFGADQLDRPENPKNARILQSFFNWYYASVGISSILAFTVIVYVQDNMGWKVGLAVPVVVMLISTLLFFIGSPLYVKHKANKSVFNGLLQAISAAFKNRRLEIPQGEEVCYHHTKGSHLTAPTDKLRFLNKACVIRNKETDLKADGTAADPWKLCTVEQIENLKPLVKLTPIWSAGIIMAVLSNQNSIPVYQAQTMDRRVGTNFEIPAGSFPVVAILTFTVWVAIYDRIFVPLLASITGNPRGIGHKQRMAIGLVLAFAATSVSAVVESARRRTAIQQGLAEQPQATVNMSGLYLLPQYILSGLSEGFNTIGQVDFYYNELPKTMSSFGVGLLTLVLAVGNLVASVILGLVDGATKETGSGSWVSDNPNKAHYDYYYWVLSILSLLNFFYFLCCAWLYGPSKEHLSRVNDVNDEEEAEKFEDFSKSQELVALK